MHSPVDLVGQERELEHVHRAAACLEVFLEAGALKPALALILQGGDPALQPVRDAQGVGVLPRDVAQGRKGRTRSLMQLIEEPLHLCNKGGVIACEVFGHRQAQVPAVTLVEKDLDASADLARTDAPCQTPQRAFDVLAGAEPVGPVIRAPAGVDALPDAADFHRVGIAAGRRHRVIAEGAVLLIHWPDFGDLGSTTPLSPLDLFFVRRMPALKGRSDRPLSTPRSLVCTLPRHGCALIPEYAVALHTGATVPSIACARGRVRYGSLGLSRDNVGRDGHTVFEGAYDDIVMKAVMVAKPNSAVWRIP